MNKEEFTRIRKSLGWSIKDCSLHILVNERNIRKIEDGKLAISGPVGQLMRIYSEEVEG